MDKRLIFVGLLTIIGLLAFEIFNFSSTQYALLDILGNLSFGGMRWSNILAFAFCGIDFAGIARIFTPEKGSDEPAEVWYLFGGWLLAAAFNAILTWWGVSVAMISVGNHISIIPVIAALLILLIRVLLIGTISLSGDLLLSRNTYINKGSVPYTEIYSVQKKEV